MDLGASSSSDWRQWDESSQAVLLEALRSEARIWYCPRGRTCDGDPHEGVPYQHARGDQWPPEGLWTFWAAISGRGGGKTATGSNWVRKLASTGRYRIGVVAPTGADLRDTIVEGESGILSACEMARTRVTYLPSKSRLEFPDTGSRIHLYSAEKPNRLRGPQHHYIWLDEAAHYDNVQSVWDMALFGLRLGASPRALVTTTPLPTKWMKALLSDPQTAVVRVSTYANLKNLAPTFAKAILEKYEGTRLGRQELHGELLEDVEGALWSYENFQYGEAPTMDRIVVAVDPAGTSTKRSDETGIVVIGVAGGHLYVLDDLSGRYTPKGWASVVVEAYERYQANTVVAEKNYGGEMVLSTLRNVSSALPVKMVTSRRGKLIRAEPVHSLYEQGRVTHVRTFEELESQLTSWIPGSGTSPDRMDALVHGAHELIKITSPVQVGNVLAAGPIRGPQRDIPHLRVIKDIERSIA